MRKIWDLFWEGLESLAFSLGLVVVAYNFLFFPTEVLGESSFPNLISGERLIVEKITYRLGEPERGDIVVILSPIDGETNFVKRVVGLPGEVIRFQNGEVVVNGQKLVEEYLPDGVLTFPLGQDQFMVPEEHYFVMGDNRGQSRDSRSFGPVIKEAILGRVVGRVWPPERAGVF